MATNRIEGPAGERLVTMEEMRIGDIGYVVEGGCANHPDSERWILRKTDEAVHLYSGTSTPTRARDYITRVRLLAPGESITITRED